MYNLLSSIRSVSEAQAGLIRQLWTVWFSLILFRGRVTNRNAWCHSLRGLPSALRHDSFPNPQSVGRKIERITHTHTNEGQRAFLSHHC